MLREEERLWLLSTILVGGKVEKNGFHDGFFLYSISSLDSLP